MKNRIPTKGEPDASDLTPAYLDEGYAPYKPDEGGEDTDETIDVRAGALPREGAPIDVPDTQEALWAEDAGYRIDENEGEGRRAADPIDLQVEADALHVIDEREL